MNRNALILFVLLGWCGCAPAQQSESGVDERGAYASAIVGNGHAFHGNASGDRSMKWRAAEVRFGRDLNPALVGAESLFNARETARIDFVYYNEGHPDNNHRDGFAFQLAYARKVSDTLTAELAAGPYLSMNTTTLGGQQINDSNLGMLYSAALRYRLDGFVKGLHLRLGVNHVAMRDVHDSNAIMFGIGRHFTDVPPFPESELQRGRLWLGAAVGNSLTTQSGTSAATGGSLEAKQYGGKWAFSVAGMVEGDDGKRVDRNGVAALFWFVQPLNAVWDISVGMGPYIAENRRDPAATNVHGLLTVQAEYGFSERLKGFASFSRVKTFHQKNDRDLFRIGFMRAFGR